MKVSVVIPVYNVKPYLERCVRSVIGQTHTDLEVIMVDDGSTDGSGALADQLATLSPCIRVIHQENQGLSGARNTGIRHATGEYIIFIDSDDEWLLPDGLETLLREAGSDAIIFKVVEVWGTGRKEYMRDYDTETLSKFSTPQVLFEYLVYNHLFRSSAVLLLVKKDVLVRNEIVFPLGYISEDVFWSLRLWQHIQTVTYKNIDFYGYYHRANSIAQTTSIRVYESYDKIFTYWKEQCKDMCVNAKAVLVYLSGLWVTLAYSFYRLPTEKKDEAMSIMLRHKDLLDYAHSTKAKRAKALVRVLGVKNTTIVLGWYWRIRSIIKRNVV